MIYNKEDLDILMKILNSSENANIKGGIATEGYQRIFDFSRDSWKDLIRKLCSKTWLQEDRISYIPLIENKLSERIIKGSCKLSDVNKLMSVHNKKFINGNVISMEESKENKIDNSGNLLSFDELINL